MDNKNMSQIVSFLWRLLYHSGDSIVLFPLFLILFFISSPVVSEYSALIFSSMTVSGILVWSLKRIIRKERPAGTEGNFYRKSDRYSFPSGHAARAWTIVTVLIQNNFFFSILSSVWALAITYSRYRLKLHFFSDIIAGAVTGIGAGIFTLWLNKKYDFDVLHFILAFLGFSIS